MINNKKCKVFFMAASVVMNFGLVNDGWGSTRPTYTDLGGDKKIDVAGIGIQGLRLVESFQGGDEARKKAEEAAENLRKTLNDVTRKLRKKKFLLQPELKIAIGIQGPNSVAGLAENLFIRIGNMVCNYYKQSISDISEDLYSITKLSEPFNLNDAPKHVSDFCFDIVAFAREALETKHYYGYPNGTIKSIIDRLPYVSIATYLKNNTFLCDDAKKTKVCNSYNNLILASDLDLYL